LERWYKSQKLKAVGNFLLVLVLSLVEKTEDVENILQYLFMGEAK
jgi:hypothetical protein